MIRNKLANNINESVLEKIALEVEDQAGLMRSPVSETLGRTSTPLIAAILGSTSPMGRGASSDHPEMERILDSMRDLPELDDVRVNLGGTAPLDSIRRVWDNKNTGMLGKMMGTVLSPLVTGQAALTRADHYDPYSNTVNVFSPEASILRHELGHAIDFKRKGYPTAYAMARSGIPGTSVTGIPGVDWYQEGMASTYAGDDAARGIVQALESGNEEELAAAVADAKLTNKQLGGALGSYVGAPLGGLLGALLAAGYVRRRGMPKGLEEIIGKVPSIFQDRVASQYGAMAGALLGLPAGVIGGRALGSYVAPFMQGESRDVYEQGLAELEAMRGKQAQKYDPNTDLLREKQAQECDPNTDLLRNKLAYDIARFSQEKLVAMRGRNGMYQS